jgi:uncharacterized protein YlaI
MAGTFVCPECDVRVHVPTWDGGKPPLCNNENQHWNEEHKMFHVD